MITLEYISYGDTQYYHTRICKYRKGDTQNDYTRVCKFVS